MLLGPPRATLGTVLAIIGIVMLLLLPPPWNFLGVPIAIVGAIGPVMFWHRQVRGIGVQAGAETLVGETATVVAPCVPKGQVRFRGEGEIWSARCAGGAGRGESVRVANVADITLVVEPVRGPRGTGRNAAPRAQKPQPIAEPGSRASSGAS